MTEYLDKRSNFISVYFFIGITIFFTFLLEVFISNFFELSVYLPLTLMVLIYWNMALPKNIGLIWAMIFGFCLDINQEILLGSHVILFLFISYFTQRYFHRLRALYTVQQSLFVAIIVLIYQIFLIFFLSEFTDTIIIELVLMTVMAALIWPIIFGILRQLRIKFVQSN
ncbi:MAG: rod shape-determining protein MreD [Gammaproteobacteria bacterium]|jgi:rod shape-determining protein MreD|tara:strand:+ start:329 stop:835 length:507 start_codon:yes stop_codon:yes gene_type:complete